MPDTKHSDCPFCLDNGQVSIIHREKGFYLTHVRIGGEVQSGRYFVIPDEHITDYNKLPGDWWGTLCTLVTQVPGYTPGMSWNFSMNIGKDAGQRQPHIHFWIIIRDPEVEGEAAGLGFSKLIELHKPRPGISFATILRR